jgi:hypothetical protein
VLYDSACLKQYIYKNSLKTTYADEREEDISGVLVDVDEGDGLKCYNLKLPSLKPMIRD